MLINARSQIDQASLALVIQQATSGAAFSGNVLAYVNGGGWLGNGVVYVTGAQDITGIKRFLDSPRVPYSGTSGSAPSAKWVNDQIGSYSGWAANTYVLPSTLTATGAAIYTLIVNASGALTGQGGGGSDNVGDWNSVYTTGDQSIGGIKSFAVSPLVPATIGMLVGGTEATNYDDLISVSGGLQAQIGAGGSSVKVTGSSSIASPNFTGAGSVFLSYDGTYIRVSGSGAGGGGGITNNYFITGTGVVAASSTGNVTNTINVTSGNITIISSGTVNNAFNGTVNQTTNIGVATGNFVNMSFFFDEFTLATGLNQVESFVGRTFTFTGYALGAITSASQGFVSGSFYQRNQTNVKTNFVDFSLGTSMVCSGRGDFAISITGMNRVGLDIYQIGTGVTGLSIGLFGLGF